MKDTKLERLYRSVGLEFFVDNIEKCLNKFNELKSTKIKESFINELFITEKRDSDINGTRIRVNCMIKIIEANKYKDVLKVIELSKRLSYEYRKKATEMINKIENGKINHF